MTNVDLVKRFATAFSEGDTATLDDILANDFVFDHANQEGTSNREEYIHMVSNLKTAFPDLRFNIRNIEDGQTVNAEVRIEGTHEGILDLTPVGLSTVPPTHNRLDMPFEPSDWTIKNGKVVAHTVEATPGGGVPGLLKSLGVAIPQQH